MRKLLVPNFRELKRSIFNPSKSILKAWEAFTILRKAFSKREKHLQFFKKHSQSVRSIFNSSKSILKAWEAFSILWKAFTKCEKHFQFFKKHSQSVRSIFNSSKNILKSVGIISNSRRRHSQVREAFSILKGAFVKRFLKEGDQFSRNTPIQACVILNSHKIIFIFGQEKACPRKGILNIPWRHSENAHRFGQHRHDFLSRASRVRLEK